MPCRGAINMASLSLFVLIQILPIASAQSLAPSQTSTLSLITTRPTATSTGSPSSSSSNEPKTHTVAVGAGGFKFTPDTLENVQVNDVVSFEFYPPDHSVARAEFGSPCVPYEYSGKEKSGGFWSGTQYVNSISDITTFNITVKDENPMAFYCGAPGSCSTKKMIGVINPNATHNLSSQLKAITSGVLELQPGATIPPEHSGSSSSPTSVNSHHNNHHGSHGLSGGAIAGVVVGAVAFLALCAALFFFVGRAKSLKEVMARKDATVKTTPPAPESHSPGFPGGPLSPLSPYAYSAVEQQHEYARMSGLPPYPTSPQPQMTEKNTQNTQPHYAGAAELASPQPQQTSFVAELEASTKSPRS